jgi:hypothetical protein
MAQIEMHIAKPCNQSWTAMKGDEQVRHCGACRKNVYNISEMSEAEVEDLIRRTDGKFCARLYRRTDNRVMTSDCPKGVAAVRRRRTLAVTASFGVAATVLWPVMRSATMGAVAPARRQSNGDKSDEPTMGVAKVDYKEMVMGNTISREVRPGRISVIPKRPKP